MNTNYSFSNNEEVKKMVIAQSNKLTLSKQEMSISCRRLMYLVIYKIREMKLKKDQIDDLTPISVSVSLSEMRKYKVLSKTNIMFRMFDEMSDFSDKSLSITYRTINGEKIRYIHTRWILEFMYINNVLTLNISGVFANLVSNLKGNFTMFNPLIPLSFKRISTQRFFELCHMFISYRMEKGKNPRIKVSDILYMFGLEDNNSYKRNFFDLKKRIIDPAQEELFDMFDKGKSDVCFKYKRIKEHDDNYIELEIIPKNKKDILRECNIRIANSIIELVSKYIRNNKNRIEKLREYILSLEKKDVLRMQNKIKNKIEEYRSDNKEQNYNKTVIAKVLSTILKEDYNI